jgi:hypothetical protein
LGICALLVGCVGFRILVGRVLVGCFRFLVVVVFLLLVVEFLAGLLVVEVVVLKRIGSGGGWHVVVLFYGVLLFSLGSIMM